MAHSMRRDPFARGEYGRVCHGPGQCAWCGQTRPRLHLRLGQGRPNTVHDARPSQSQDVLCVQLFHRLPLMRTPPCHNTRNALSPSSSRLS
jgi:hypothetical protein